MENKEKVASEATESEVATLSINTSTTFTLCQCCLLCDNTRPFVNGYPPGPSPWVCNECREAIAYLKTIKRRDPCELILD